MNLKVVHLVAIQFGIFVGIMSWLGYSHFESAKPPRIAEERPTAPVNSVAPVTPIAEPEGQRPNRVDYRADADRIQPVAEQPVRVMQHEYSPAAVQQNMALAEQLYYQQIAPPLYAANSRVANSSITADAPSYAEVAQEPILQAEDPELRTVADVQPTQIVFYQPTQFVAFSNARSFRNRNRCRPAPHPNALAPTTHRRPNRGAHHLGGSRDSRPAKSFGVVHRRHASAPVCRPNQGFAPRGKR